jgi:hypothetical protein
MANVSLLWNKTSDTGTYSQGSWEASLPLANLAQEDVQRVARSTGLAAGATKFRIDLGAGLPIVASDFVLLNHNASTAATIRIVVTNNAADADAGQRALDTGVMPVWGPTVIPGSMPWGTFPWDGIDPRAYPSGYVFFHHADGAPIGRYIWVYLSDPANPAGFLQAGRFMSGAAWSPRSNVDYGTSIRWIDPSEARRTGGGRRLVVGRPRYRQFEMVFHRLTKNEAFGIALEVDRQLGKGGNFFLAMDREEDGAFRFRRSVYAALVDTAPVGIPRLNTWTWSLSGEELI